MRRQSAFGLIVATALVFGPAQIVRAQDAGLVRSPVLVVESDRLYLESAYGKRVAAEIARFSADLATENRQIEAELEEEEKDLTEKRPDLSPEEFRQLADAFDQKVRNIRKEQESKARAMVQRQEKARAAFLSAAAPVLERIMQEAGAVVVLERRNVFLSLNAIDITRDALDRIDQEIGDGTRDDAQDDAQTESAPADE